MDKGSKKMKISVTYFLILILISSCGYMETKKENLRRTSFAEQETLYLNRFPIDIIPTYYVWDAKYSEFLDMEDAKEGTLYKAINKPNIEKNIYSLSDIKNKTELTLIENIDPSSDFLYEITLGKKRVAVIKAIDKDDIFNYDLVINDHSSDDFYRIEGKSKAMKTTGVNPDIIHGFGFDIKKEDLTYCSIFKEYYVFKNEYEIIVNKSQDIIDNSIFVCVSLFIDLILKENGYEFR